MPRCQPPGLLASAHIDGWNLANRNCDRRDHSEIARLPTLWRSTAIQCSRFCDGCTVLNIGSLGYSALTMASVVVFAACKRPIPASFAALYCASGYSEVTSALEMMRAVIAAAVAATAAGDPDVTFFAWLASIAALVHTVRSAMYIEIELQADCAHCCNEAHRCKCGRRKKTIPQGSLAHLSTVVSQRWRARVQENTCEL